MVAAVCGWHEFHPAAASAVEERLAGRHRLISPAHAVTEAYAVLTRLPAPHRLAPSDAWKLLSSNFITSSSVIVLPAIDHVATLRDLATSGKGGGRTYDALIAATAQHAGVDELLTFNPKHFEDVEGLTIVGLP